MDRSRGKKKKKKTCIEKYAPVSWTTTGDGGSLIVFNTVLLHDRRIINK